MNNKANNNKHSTQFTELTPTDIATHRDLYTNLLMSNFYDPYFDVCLDYAVKELQKAKQLFYETFK